MIDPETARQAVKRWTTAVHSAPFGPLDEYLRDVKSAGDALAKLVPQLLDQLAAERDAVKDILSSAPAPQIIADLRGQLAEQYAQMEGADAHISGLLYECKQRKTELAALGERCRQAEKERDDNFVTIDTLEADYAQLLDRLGETAHLDDALNARLRAENVQLLNQLAEMKADRDDWNARVRESDERCRQLEAALQGSEDARRLARRCVGSLPGDLAQNFEWRQDEAESMARAALRDTPPTDVEERWYIEGVEVTREQFYAWRLLSDPEPPKP